MRKLIQFVQFLIFELLISQVGTQIPIGLIISSVANEVRAKREPSSRNEYMKFAFCKNGVQIETLML